MAHIVEQMSGMGKRNRRQLVRNLFLLLGVGSSLGASGQWLPNAAAIPSKEGNASRSWFMDAMAALEQLVQFPKYP